MAKLESSSSPCFNNKVKEFYKEQREMYEAGMIAMKLVGNLEAESDREIKEALELGMLSLEPLEQQFLKTRATVDRVLAAYTANYQKKEN